MRINIQVPDGDTVVASSSQLSLADVPAPLVRLAPSNELVLIELQGSLEIDDADPNGGQVLAKLEFHPGREDRPTLLVSHHRLEGKLVSLTKPMAVLEMKKRPMENAAVAPQDHHLPVTTRQTVQGANTSPSSDLPSSPSRFDEQGQKARQDLPDDDAPVSPSLTRKRARGTETDDAKTTNVPSSSSPVPVPRAIGSEMDFSSPLPACKRRATGAMAIASHTPSRRIDEASFDKADEDDTWLNKRDTATYMEVVCIIRRKVLFSKRPEPVVRLDSEGGKEARAALGLA